MSKTSTELIRLALNGPPMGTRWSALFFAVPGFDTGPVQAALQQATDEVDAQMSTWNPGTRPEPSPATRWPSRPVWPR